MKIVKIAAVLTAKSGKVYVTNAKGDALFFNKGMEPKVGDYALVREGFQTQDKDGKELETPIPVQLIASLWKDKNAAIEANSEERLNAMEEHAYVVSKTASIAETYKVDAKELAAAW